MEFEKVKTILQRVKDGDKWFGHDYNMNIYRGCSHGCIYCDSRSSNYGILDFDRVRAKENSIGILENELKSKIKKGVVGMGAMSDPYNPMERKYELTRESLKLIDRYGFGISITTKSNLILRDMDILKSIKSHSPVLVNLTITNAGDKLSSIIEPNVSKSSERFNTIKILNENNIYSGIILMPILPFINDNIENILGIINSGYESNTKYIYPYFGMTLRDNQRNWYYDRLDESFPGLREEYIKKYGDSYVCPSDNYYELNQIFKDGCTKYNIDYKMKDIIFGYKNKYILEQISFL